MGLKSIEALFVCGNCATEFSINLDLKTKPLPKESLHDMAIAAIVRGVYTGRIGPPGVTSRQSGKHLCAYCTALWVG